jgi:phosphoserine aminotransferase
MWNTPATLNIWTTGKLARWMEAEGGLGEMERRAAAKAAAVYGAIDGSGGFFGTPVANEGERSRMNVPFNVAGGDEEATHAFLREAYEQNMVGFRTMCAAR